MLTTRQLADESAFKDAVKNPPDPPAAAAIVKHRGVSVAIYGPLKDRKKEVYLLVYHVGSRREKCTSKGSLDVAKKAAKTVAEGIAGGDLIDALHLTPLDRRVFVTAKEAVASTGVAVDAICRDAVAAMKALGPGVTLAEAAKFYAAQHTTALPSATPAEVAAELFLWMKAKRRKAGSINALKSVYTSLEKAFAVPIASITTLDLDRWLATHLTHTPRTQANYITSLVTLFNFAKGRYLPLDVPSAAERLKPPSQDNLSPVAIFSPWELEKILRNAPEDLLPCIVLGAFAGVRTIELTRMEWSAVHLQTSAKFPHGYVEISAAVAKQHRTAARRLIPMSENLAAWLLPYRMKAGPISPDSIDTVLSRHITALIRRINKAETASKRRVLRRPPNGLRHSFGSYRLPILDDVAALALEMNTSPAKIYANYRELVQPADVEAWWKIMPVHHGKVTPMPKADAGK